MDLGTILEWAAQKQNTPPALLRQECRHNDGEAETRDRVPPARGSMYLARGIVTEWPRPGISILAGSAGLGERSE